MTERDRLAADLTSLIVDIEEERLPVECVADECSHADGEHPEPGVHCGDGKRLADRLIALGWTRLDMRRVVRAIHTVAARHGIGRDTPPPLSVLNIYGYTRATPDMDEEVAKAYREDTDA